MSTGDKERLTVRLGGIYALEQLARESAQDHWQIMEVLTAYVRDNAPWSSKDAQPLQGDQALQEKQREENKRPLGVPPRFSLKPGTDIQAILTVLGRRTRTYGKGESQRLNLSGIALQGARLEGAHLWNTELWGADLRGADLRGAKDLTQQQTNMICVDERTQLPEGLTQPPPCRVTQP